MKRFLPFFLIICLLLTSCQQTNREKCGETPTDSPEETIRAVWISCYEYISAANKTENDYKKITDKMFTNIRNCGFNTAFVHLRAFGDSFYESEIFPYSSYIAGKEGAALPFDPFKVLLSSAEENGISVHGWINPFRISIKNDPELLCADNPAKRILDSGNADGDVCILENGIYLNPASTAAQKLVLDGVREILSKYKIDGIHIDDYFYPSTDASIDLKQYSQYCAQGGSLSLGQWRTQSVSAFVSGLYSAVKAVDPSLTVSISPSANIKNNKTELYADCELWLSQKGFADIIIPQIYFGFEHEKYPFHRLLKEWSALPRHSEVKLMCGLGAYKCSSRDEYALSGSEEWLNNSDILARQLKAVRADGNYTGFALFSYGDLLRENCSAEIGNLLNLIIK